MLKKGYSLLQIGIKFPAEIALSKVYTFIFQLKKKNYKLKKVHQEIR
jgi:hypothetical protein